MAASIKLDNSNIFPIKCEVINGPARLSSILAELEKWTQMARLQPIDKPLENYIDISDQLRVCLHSRYLLASDKEYSPAKDSQFVLAAFDNQDHLQGIAMADIINRNGVAIKVLYIVTAFWNMPFSKSAQSNRGAGTCLMQRIIELRTRPGQIVLESRNESSRFFEKLHFKITKVYLESRSMALAPEDFPIVALKAKSQLVSCDESKIPQE